MSGLPLKSSFQRSDMPVDSYVVPLMIATVRMADPQHPAHVESVEGTGFLIAGGRGLGITARHVAKALRAATSIPDGRLAVASFVDDNGYFQSSVIGRFDLHPTEDVALFRLEPDDFFSPLSVSADQHYGSTHYQLWGYPDDVRYDRIEHEGGALHVPCVYSAGHIRRRISHELVINNVPGRSFYELSTPAGGCCSGAPVSPQNEPFRVIGVYVGERRSNENTFAVGFATRSQVLAQQWPQLVEDSDLSGLCPFDGPTPGWTGP